MPWWRRSGSMNVALCGAETHSVQRHGEQVCYEKRGLCGIRSDAWSRPSAVRWPGGVLLRGFTTLLGVSGFRWVAGI